MSNKLKINQTGSLKPLYPQKSFDKRNYIITNKATDLGSAPLFYVGQQRVNKLSSGNNINNTLAIMKYGNPTTIHGIYGNVYNSIGNLYPNNDANFKFTIDQKGNYKLISPNGKSYKVHYGKNGSFIKQMNKKIYL